MSNRRAGIILLSAVAGVALLTVVLAWAPYWFPRTPGIDSPGDARWLSQEIGRNRTAMLTVLGGGLAAVGAWLTWLNVKLGRRGQLTDRFAKSVELLAHAEEAVRLGGVYALHAIARESSEDRQSAQNVLRFHADHVGDRVADGAAALDVLENLSPDSPAGRAAHDAEVSLVRMRALTTAVRGAFAAAIVAAAALPIYATSRVAGELRGKSTYVNLNVPLAIVSALALAGIALLYIRGRNQRAAIQRLQRRTEMLERPIVLEREARPYAEFGQLLEAARVAAGISRVSLARELGILDRAVSRYEAGERLPKRQIVDRWQRVTEVDDARLLRSYDEHRSA